MIGSIIPGGDPVDPNPTMPASVWTSINVNRAGWCSSERMSVIRMAGAPSGRLWTARQFLPDQHHMIEHQARPIPNLVVEDFKLQLLAGNLVQRINHQLKVL